MGSETFTGRGLSQAANATQIIPVIIFHTPDSLMEANERHRTGRRQERKKIATRHFSLEILE